jgi:hypothetical protein
VAVPLAAENRAFHKAVVSVLTRALECFLNPPPDFRDPQWWRLTDGLAERFGASNQSAELVIFALIGSKCEQ